MTEPANAGCETSDSSTQSAASMIITFSLLKLYFVGLTPTDTSLIVPSDAKIIASLPSAVALTFATNIIASGVSTRSVT